MMFFLIHVVKDFHKYRGYGDRKNNSEEAHKFCARDQGDDRDNRGNAHDFFDDEGVNELILKLLNDDIEKDNNEGEGETAVNQGNGNRGHRREYWPENGNQFKECGDNGEEK